MHDWTYFILVIRSYSITLLWLNFDNYVVTIITIITILILIIVLSSYLLRISFKQVKWYKNLIKNMIEVCRFRFFFFCCCWNFSWIVSHISVISNLKCYVNFSLFLYRILILHWYYTNTCTHLYKHTYYIHTRTHTYITTCEKAYNFYKNLFLK